MTIEALQAARIAAMKNHDLKTKEVINSMIDVCQKATITSKGRIEMTEQLVNETLIKYQKTIQEMIDTCPASRTDLMEKYQFEMNVVKEFAPQLMTDPQEIKTRFLEIIAAYDIEAVVANKGKIMKVITPFFKGKADMKIVNAVVTETLI